MLEKEYKHFLSIQDELIKDHFEEYVVIKDTQILGFYSSEEEAFKSMIGNELGTFLTKQCIPGDDRVHRFHSRVAFA